VRYSTEKATRDIYLDGVTDEDRSELALLKAASDSAKAQYRQVMYGSNVAARANRFVALQMAYWAEWPLQDAIQLEQDYPDLEGVELDRQISRLGSTAQTFCGHMVRTLSQVIAKPVG
jgi:hypothetical protein